MHYSLPCHTGFQRVFNDPVADFLFIFLHFNIKTSVRILTDIPDIISPTELSSLHYIQGAWGSVVVTALHY
jgi:hypothetical protein